MKVLIADDDPVSRIMVRVPLLRLGYDVREVADGEQAWSLLQSEPFSIMITDWLMPRLDGPGLIQRIRNADFPNYVYSILLTSKDAKDDIIAGLDAGADDYLSKPLHPNELRARISIATRIIDLETRLRAERDTDALTSLRNRRAISVAAHAELSRAAREHTALSVVLIDIDHFKQVNDTHGHQAGDQALRLVAATITQNLRPYDSVGRWGGEEILLLLPSTTSEHAASVAERVRAAIAATPLLLETGQAVPLSVSMGLASTDSVDLNQFEPLLQCADSALYQAKQHGRDQVAIYQPAPASSP